MNDDIEKTNLPKQPLQPFHVFLGDGRTVAIEAAAFEHEVNAEERIVFVDSDGAPIEHIFVRAQAVDMIVPDSAIAKTHSFVEMQNQVNTLTERINRVETALASLHSPTGE